VQRPIQVACVAGTRQSRSCALKQL
jgi:hypothetical protein